MSENAPTVATLASEPKAGQVIEHQNTTYTTIKEGLAYILVPPNAKTYVDPKAPRKPTEEADQAQDVFYNPIQQFNRDLSVLAIRAFGEDFFERRRQKFEKKSQQLRNKKDKKKQTKGQNEIKAAPETNGIANATTADNVPGTNAESGKDSTAEEVAVNGNANGTLKRKADEDLEKDAEAKKPKNDVELMDVSVEAVEPAKDGAEPVTDSTLNSTPADTYKLRVLDALSATGLRALRYAQEFTFPTTVVANDMLPAATDSIALNVEHNGLKDKITPCTSNAMAHMYNAAFLNAPHAYGKYDVIDLDPYGTAAPFLEAALLATNDNGLLCVTCTDAGVWASCGYVEKSYALYGGLSVKGPHSHEAGLRLILHSIASSAAKHGISIEPLLSLSIDFYARVFVRVRKSPAEVKFLAGKTIVVNQCDSGCGSWTTQTLARNVAQVGKNNTPFFKHSPAQSTGHTHCPHCNQKTHVAGPMWGGPLHNPFFISRILSYLPTLSSTTYATIPRIEGMLTSALDELATLDPTTKETTPESTLADNAENRTSLIPALKPDTADTHPFFFIPSALAKVLHTQAPSEAAIKGALRHAGYVATRSHTKPGCVKTQAPFDVIWDIMREWVRQKASIRESSVREGSAGWYILKDYIVKDAEEVEVLEKKSLKLKESERKVVFDEVLGKDREGRGKRLMRYQLNPRANWGPMARAKGKN